MKDRIMIQKPKDIDHAYSAIENGTFRSESRSSFNQYPHPEETHFCILRTFNDETLSLEPYGHLLSH
jgi:hypothetical protein